jgi:hypothetical protein
MQSGVYLIVEVENAKFVMFWLAHLLRVMLRVENTTLIINHHFDCYSEGVVYLVICKACKMQYVNIFQNTSFSRWLTVQLLK